MKNFSPFGRNPITVLGTILVVVFLCASYLYVYRPNNERRIREQGFRAMQNIDGNIQAKITNGVSLLNNVLSAYINSSNGGQREAILHYTKSISSPSLTISPLDTLGKRNIEKIFSPGSDSVYTIRVDTLLQQFNLILAKRVGGNAYQVSMRIGFAQFIKPLLPDNVLFDQYLVFSDGRTVYQTFPSGFSQVRPDSLLSEKNGIKGAGILTRKISGTTYQMFVQPVNFIVHSNWVIVGLLSDEKYQYEKNQLPPDTVLFMITVALAIIVSFPLIKLYHMGSQDRLTIFDGAWSVMVAMLLMSLLFFSFFKYNTPFRPGRNIDPKDNLANNIVKAFQNEIQTKYLQLLEFDNLVSKHHDTLRTDILLESKPNDTSSKILKKDFNRDKNSYTSSIDHIFKQTGPAEADINQVYWMDGHGQELFKWDYLKYNAPHGNFFQRDYVKNILSGRAYLLSGDFKKPYYLDQLISWTTGDFTTVISQKSKLSTAENTIVEAFAFNMKSLDQTILPNGYLFALINQNGKVLYHSNKNRNLNENLLQEFSNREELLSAIEAHAQKTLSTSYLGKKYDVQIKPVTGLPYFIVVFSAVVFEETRDMEVYCFTLAMLFVFFCFLIFELLTVFYVSSNRSVLKKQQFDSSWIGPKARFHQQYILSSLLNIGIVALLYIFSRFATFAAFFFILLLSATGLIAFLMSLYAQQYQKKGQKTRFKNKRKAIGTLSAFILIINLLAIFNLDNPLLFFLYEALMLLLAGLLFFYGSGWIEIGKEKLFKTFHHTWGYVHSFTLMVITRLIITSGIPVALFYVMAYNYEQNLLIRYRHYDFARHLINKYPKLNQGSLSGINNGKGVYMDGSYIDSICYFTTNKPNDIAVIAHDYSKEEAFTIAALGSFRFYHDSSAVRENNLYQFNATDGSFFYNHLYTGALNNKTDTVATFFKNPYNQGYIKIWSKNLNYRLPSIYKNRELYFWLLMLLLLVVFYVMILNVIRKLFVLDLPETNIWNAIDNEILLCRDLNRLLFIIGLPGSHKLNYLLEMIKDKKLVQNDGTAFVYDRQQPENDNVLLLDLIQIPDDNSDPTSKDNTGWRDIEEDIFAKNYKLVLVNHFEYNIRDETTNRIKLNMLERLMSENKCKIIILSTIHPTAFLDSINAQAEATTGKAIQDLERWHILLGHYRIVIHPIEKKVSDINSEIWQKRWLKWEKRGLDSNQIGRIMNETSYARFLSQMQVATVEAASTITKKETIANGDALAFKLQVTAHYFYMYIWQSLTKEEKFLLYDLAEDGLVNGFDAYNLSMLISKGVIVREDTTLKLFNSSFRNFILTAIGNTEAKKIKSQMQDNGNWNKLKTPLLVVIFAILAFLLTSQQEAYSKLIAYVSALAAGIPVFVKLISMFDSSGSQKSA